MPSKLEILRLLALKDKGAYGAQRVERAADEIKNLTKLYSPDALRSAFLGDNAKALMTMNPKDFERYATPLVTRTSTLGKKVDPDIIRRHGDKMGMTTDDYLKTLQKVRGGFADVPYLEINKSRPTNLFALPPVEDLPTTPFISGHEGRHRNRAMAESGERAGLVRLEPRTELREGFPRRSQEEYIEALRQELGMTGNMVVPQRDYDAISGTVIRPEIDLPPIYKQGGVVNMAGGGRTGAALGIGQMLKELVSKGNVAPVSRIDMGFKDVSQRVPELTIAANLLKAGKISADDYAQLVNALKPVTPYAFVPKPATRSEAMNALTVNKRKGYGGTSKIEGGESVDARLDIPAYTEHGVWVDSIHRAGAPTSYSSTSSVNTPLIVIPQDKALKVATGETAKSPFAVMRGEWNPLSEKEAVKLAQKSLNNPDWVQVGIDPERHAYGYDRKTMQPVIGGEQMVQVGPLVLLKNPVYGDTREFKFAGGGEVSQDAMRMAVMNQKVQHKKKGGVEVVEKMMKIFGRDVPIVSNDIASINKAIARGVDPQDIAYQFRNRDKENQEQNLFMLNKVLGVPPDSRVMIPQKNLGSSGLKESQPYQVPPRLPRAKNLPKKELRREAQGVAAQMNDEFVRDPLHTEVSKDTTGRSKKEFLRQQPLTHDIRPKFNDEIVPEIIDYSKYKGDVIIGIKGDPTPTDVMIHRVNDTQLTNPVESEGGPLYALRKAMKAWASNYNAASGVQNLVNTASQQYGGRGVLGQYIKMGPDSYSYAQHFADTALNMFDPSKYTPQQIQAVNDFFRQGYLKNGKRIAFPEFAGIENPTLASLQMQVDPNLRKFFGDTLQIPKKDNAMGLPSGTDIAHALTEPDLRNLETGITGKSVMQMEPGTFILDPSLSKTYDTDIARKKGTPLMQSSVPTPYDITFNDTVAQIRANPKQGGAQEFGSLGMVGPRQVIDNQWLDQYNTYRDYIKQYTGRKKGGAVNMKGGSLVEELINEEKKNAPPYVATDKRYNPPMTGENAPRLAPREGSKKPYFQVPATMFPEGIMRDVAESAYRDIGPSIVFPELQLDPIKTIGQHSYAAPVDIGSALTEAGIALDFGNQLLGEAVFNATNSPLLATAAAYGPSVAGSVYKGAKNVAKKFVSPLNRMSKAEYERIMMEEALRNRAKELPAQRLLNAPKEREKTTFEMQNELAQKRAMLPKDQYGLELPAGNTAAQRLAAMGINTDAYHGTKQNITGAFKPGYDDNLGFVTRDADFANSWIGKGKIQQRADPEAKAELKAAEDLYRAIKEKHMDYGSVDLKSPDFHDIFEKRNDAFQKAFNEDVGLYPDKTHSTVYPLKVQANNTFDPETNMDVMSEFFAKNNVPLQNQELYKSGNYLMYETKPVVNFLKSKGYDSMRLRESTGDNYPTIAVFDPETIRSRFAAGDPFRRNAAVAAAMGVAAPDLLAAEDKAEGGAITSDDLILEESPL